MTQIHETTRMVIEALPAEQKELWKEVQEILWTRQGSVEGSFSPDIYESAASAEDRKLVLPYGLEIRGRLFHNFPMEMETTEGTGAWQTNMQNNWRFITDGFCYYLSAVVKSIKASQMAQAAGFMNWLCHVLQDQASFLHALQGPGGFQPFLFSEFFPPPPTEPCKNANLFLETETCPAVRPKGYKPLLLGTSIPEAVFGLYQRYRQINRHNRWNLIPLIQSGYAGDKSREIDIRRAMATRVCELLLDVFHTVYCLAKEEFSVEEQKRLNTVDMTTLFPIEYPNHLSPPYRFSPVINGGCLDSGSKLVALQLFLKEGSGKKLVTFDCGLGTGAHYEYVISYGIPKDVYQSVRLAVGLHADLGQKGHIEVIIKLNKKTLFQKEFLGSSQAERFTADVSPGGFLRWTVRALTEHWSDSNNHVVWAEPILSKRPIG